MITQQEIINKAIDMDQKDGYIDLVKLSDSLGIEVIAESRNDDKNGYITYDNNVFTIFVNANHGNSRRRFSIAHELAHYVLHSDIVKEKKQVDRNGACSLEKEKEVEANKLAAKILMPDILVKDYLSTLGIIESSEINREIVLKVAKRFSVSEMAAILKLEDLSYFIPYNNV